MRGWPTVLVLVLAVSPSAAQPCIDELLSPVDVELARGCFAVDLATGCP